jgi:hypothetical protein
VCVCVCVCILCTHNTTCAGLLPPCFWPISRIFATNPSSCVYMWCVCVCVRERERERERVCVCARVCATMHIHQAKRKLTWGLVRTMPGVRQCVNSSGLVRALEHFGSRYTLMGGDGCHALGGWGRGVATSLSLFYLPARLSVCLSHSLSLHAHSTHFPDLPQGLSVCLSVCLCLPLLSHRSLTQGLSVCLPVCPSLPRTLNSLSPPPTTTLPTKRTFAHTQPHPHPHTQCPHLPCRCTLH